MTEVQKKISAKLAQCRIHNIPDARFIKQLDTWNNRSMTEKGSQRLKELLKIYSKQIPDWFELTYEMAQEQIDSLGL